MIILNGITARTAAEDVPLVKNDSGKTAIRQRKRSWAAAHFLLALHSVSPLIKDPSPWFVL